MNRAFIFPIFIVALLLLTACGGEEKDAPIASPQSELILSKGKISPQFTSKAKNGVVTQQAANANGQFIQPADGEVFTGNILVAITASDPDGLVSVALSFNQSTALKYLCEPGDDCPAGSFNKTETNINPADYGVFVGPLTMGLWTLDTLGNQMLVDSVTLDWQLRRIVGASATRSVDGSTITVDWQTNNDLLRYNVLSAAEQGVTLQNYSSLSGGQALLAVQSGPQTIASLSSSEEYYVMITGVDGSGESAFSSEFRLAQPSGMVNTPPQVNTEIFSSPENQAINGNVLINDTDPQGDPLSVSPLPIKFPLNGDVSLSRDGNFIYQPRANFFGLDSFIYEVQDGQGGIAQGTVNISIDNVNDPPIAAPDVFSTPQNQSLTISAPGILSNDYDIDGDVIQVNTTPVVDVSNGQLTLMADGSFSYLPNSDFTGSDTFTYQILDPQGLSDSAIVTISVGQGNTAPIAVNDSYQMAEDQTLIVDASASNSLLANDSDAENDPLTLEPDLISTVSNGVLTIDDQGGFTYVPNANFFGSDSFTYQINDGQGNTAQATATITIDPVNDAPNALDDAYTVITDTTLTVNAPGLLANDTDLDDDGLSVLLVPESEPANGVLNLLADGGFIYTPNSGFSGQDSFTYQISDGRGGTASAQVTLTVQAQQILRAVSLTTVGPLTLNGLGETSPGSGIGQSRFTLGNCLQTSDTECTLTGTYQEQASSDYDPNSSGSFTMVFAFSGVGESPAIVASTTPGGDTFSFTDLGNSVFTLTLLPNSGGEIIGRFPTSIASENMGFSVFYDTSTTCTGLAVGQSCSVGQVGLTPGASITGELASFTFFIPNPVLNNNMSPIANDDSASTDEDNAVTINVLANDSDPDGDTLQVIDATVDFGVVTIENDYQLTYVPEADFNGSATISYTIYDGNGHTDTASVDVTVLPINDAPVVMPETGLITNSIQPMIIDALANDSDIDDDSLTLTNASTNFGSVTIVNNQLLFSGDGVPESTVIQISYTVSDGNGGTTVGLVTIVIGNTWPAVNPDSYKLLPNSTINVDGSIYALPITNDTDANSTDTLSYVQQVYAVQHGSYGENSSFPSGFSYAANSGFSGIDGGFYEINDGSGNDGEGLFTLQVSDVDWNKSLSSPKVPALDFLDITFDGIDYVLFNNDAVVTSPIVASGRYFAISGRMVISSSDKSNWQIEYATNNGNLSAIASGYTIQNPSIDTHIAVGNLGTVLINQSSSSGQAHWLEISTGLNSQFNNIQFDGQRFMAVGQQSVAFTNDGYSWSAVPTVNNVNYRDIIFAGGQYLIVGDSGNIELSSNGLSWQPQSSSTTEQLNSIAYNGSTYVSVGNGGAIVTSNSGLTWTTATSGVTVNLNQIIWSGSQFVAVGDGSTVLTSTDGVSWLSQSGIDTGNIRSILSDGSALLIGTNNGELFSSSDAVNFSPLHTSTDKMNAVAFDGNGKIVRAGNPSFINLSSDNGQNWTQLTALGAMNINEINYFNGQFIAVGDNGLIMFSTDGSNWTPRTSGTTENLNDVFWFSGVDVQGAPFSLYVVVGNNGTILASQTGSLWIQELPSPTTSDDLLAVSHDDDYFVIVGNNGRILVRNNTVLPGATTWMDFFSNASWGRLNDIFFNGSNCVIVGDNGQLVTGTAMSAFTGGTSLTTLDLFSVSGSGANVIAVGQSGVTFFSRDGGGSWHSAVQGSEFSLFDVDYNTASNTFYSVGERGTFLSGTSNIN